MKREADTKREIVEKRNTNSSSFFFFELTITPYTVVSTTKKNERISQK